MKCARLGVPEDKPKDKQEQHASNHSSFARPSEAAAEGEGERRSREEGDGSKGQQLSRKSKAQLVNFSIIFMSERGSMRGIDKPVFPAASSIKTKDAKASLPS